MVNDMVNHPPHYTSHKSGVECIQITEHMGFNLGNCLKYVWRADLKNDAIEDLKKARFYLDREIALREREAAHPAAPLPNDPAPTLKPTAYWKGWWPLPNDPAPTAKSSPRKKRPAKKSRTKKATASVSVGTPKLVAAISALLEDAGDSGLTVSVLRASVHAKQRPSLTATLEALIDAGHIRRSGYRYIFAAA
jgi:hypothetical protein